MFLFEAALFEIRRQEILNMPPQGQILEHD